MFVPRAPAHPICSLAGFGIMQGAGLPAGRLRRLAKLFVPIAAGLHSRLRARGMQLAGGCHRQWEVTHIPLVLPALAGSLPTVSSGAALPTTEKTLRHTCPKGCLNDAGLSIAAQEGDSQCHICSGRSREGKFIPHPALTPQCKSGEESCREGCVACKDKCLLPSTVRLEKKICS